jgi:hypothetical protein
MPYYFGTTPTELLTGCSMWAARLLYVAKDRTRPVFNERVFDVTRADRSHGTEIPIVHSSEILNAPVLLLGVPIDPKFRNTLRVYSTQRTPATVQVVLNGATHELRLEPGADEFEPAMAIFNNFPRPEDLPSGNDGTVTVTVIPAAGTPIWAFISVTNNDTQQITTITPDLR